MRAALLPITMYSPAIKSHIALDRIEQCGSSATDARQSRLAAALAAPQEVHRRQLRVWQKFGADACARETTMSDLTSGSRAKRLAERLKELWEMPNTTECLRLSGDREPPKQAANANSSPEKRDKVSEASGSAKGEGTSAKSRAQRMQRAARRESLEVKS